MAGAVPAPSPGPRRYGRSRRVNAMQVIERVDAHYEVQEVDHGTVYRWCPGRLLLRCDCGERLECRSPTEHCRCGAGCAAAFEDPNHDERREGPEAPWRREPYRWPSESDYWLELRAL